MNKQDIIRQAMELGDAIASSDELQQLKQAQQEVTDDPASYQAIINYQQVRNTADTKLRQGLALSPQEEADLQTAEQAIQNDIKVKALIDMQDSFDNLMQSVYFVMNQAISGPSCGDGCESCGGHCS